MTKPSIFRYEGHNYLVPFLIISSLFFMWGFAHGILEVLNPHFQESFHISKAMSALTQAAVYGAYFLMALPAGWIIRKWGYRRGVITGLVLFGIGALMFIPGSRINSFYFFVLSLFVIGCGLTCLETSANPYTTVLGHPDKAESRINLSQSLNGIGWIVGPLVGGQLLFSGVNIAILTFVATLIVVVCSGTLSLIAFFALYLGESIMFPTIFSLALRDAGIKTKFASSLLIMTIVGGAVAPVIMGYIADTTGSMAIAFLIPLVCYGVIGTYALSNPSVSL
uniref:MFS transporter n=1 Tax=Segatella hominis TaxID=2518605 RepID=UPI00402693E4